MFRELFQKGDATMFMPVFECAKQKGFKLALHLAEVGMFINLIGSIIRQALHEQWIHKHELYVAAGQRTEYGDRSNVSFATR